MAEAKFLRLREPQASDSPDNDKNLIKHRRLSGAEATRFQNSHKSPLPFVVLPVLN